MNIPAEFDEIRPYTPEELPQVFEELLSDSSFQAVMAKIMPGVPKEVLAAQLKQCKTNLDVQKNFFYKLLHGIIREHSDGFDMDTSSIPDKQCSYTFISNHRDIVLDPGFISVGLIDNDFPTTVEIAIGDNLLIYPWIKKIVRVNKSFIVQRALSMRQMLESSARMSRYIHFAITQKHENVWIAQREGRAKDSNDRTAEAILKMMTMGGEGSIKERLLSLHLVPLAISYEYDPCDFLKAQEFQLRRDVADWKKGPMDDVISMQTGIMGYKGHIHYHAAPCIDEWLRALPDDMPKTEFYTAVAEHLDHEIWRGYRLYPSNFVALDLLRGTTEHADRYTAEDRQRFEAYLDAQLKKVQLPNPDWAFLRERILTMYANPAINQLSVI